MNHNKKLKGGYIYELLVAYSITWQPRVQCNETLTMSQPSSSVPFYTSDIPIGFYQEDLVITVKKRNKVTGVVTKYTCTGPTHVVITTQHTPLKTKMVEYKSDNIPLYPGTVHQAPLPRPVAIAEVPGAPRRMLKRTRSFIHDAPGAPSRLLGCHLDTMEELKEEEMARKKVKVEEEEEEEVPSSQPEDYVLRIHKEQ